MGNENKQKPKNEQQGRQSPDYLDLYDNHVLPTIKTCLDEMTDADFRQKYKPVFPNSKDYKKRYARAFRKNRRELKDLFYGDEEHGFLNPEKLAAVLCHTLIDCKPIKFSGNGTITSNTMSSADQRWSANHLFVNYKVAFLSSISVVYSKILAEKKPGQDSQILKDRTMARYGLYDQKSFQANVIINLARNAMLGREFDDLSFALMMFQWHEYTLLYHGMKDQPTEEEGPAEAQEETEEK